MALAVVGAGGPSARSLGELLGVAGRPRRDPDAGQVHVPVRPRQSHADRWAARASRCGSTSGSRWGSRRWRPSASNGSAGPGVVSLRGGLILAGVLVAVSIPIMIYHLCPGLDRAEPLDEPYHLDRYRWLGRELTLAARPDDPAGRARPGGSRGLRAVRHRPDSPCSMGRVACRSWSWPICWVRTGTTSSRRSTPLLDRATQDRPARFEGRPGFIRVFGHRRQAAGEPGYASEPVNFLPVRDPLDWSLPPVWQLPTSGGNTPMYSRRFSTSAIRPAPTVRCPWRHDLEGDSHILHRERSWRGAAGEQLVGSALIHRNPRPAAGPDRGPASLRR